MRTATDFDAYYQSPDPWAISQAWRRDRALLRVVGPYVAGKTVLDLGCGEGHLTSSIFGSARSVTGIDISNVAIQRAKAAKIANARFETSDFLETSFAGYDVIAAIECVYYLSPASRNSSSQSWRASTAESSCSQRQSSARTSIANISSMPK